MTKKTRLPKNTDHAVTITVHVSVSGNAVDGEGAALIAQTVLQSIVSQNQVSVASLRKWSLKRSALLIAKGIIGIGTALLVAYLVFRFGWTK